MGDVVPMRKDGVPVIPLCKDCEYFRPHMGIGNPPYCMSPQRKGNFDPVYGWQQRSMRAHDARADNQDCGMAGNFYVGKRLGFDDPLSLVDDNPFDKKPWFFSWKRFLAYIKR